MGRWGSVFLVRRFHGFPLPVPKLVVAPLKQVPTKLSNAVLALLRVGTQGRQCLLFVPRIEWLGPLAQALSQAGYSVETAHAADPDRVAKVQQFRDGTFTVLVTTTILERGVTIPRCSVLVLAADDRQFGASGLIQMAGRAGRSQASPDDPVWFVGRHMTLAMLVARHEIQVINGRKHEVPIVQSATTRRPAAGPAAQWPDNAAARALPAVFGSV